MAQAEEVNAGLGRLAGLAYTGNSEPDSLSTDVLRLVAESLDVGLTFLSTVDDTTLYVEGVYDRAGMGLENGTAVPLCDTY